MTIRETRAMVKWGASLLAAISGGLAWGPAVGGFIFGVALLVGIVEAES